MDVLGSEWKRNEYHAGRVDVGDALSVEVRVAPWRMPGGDAEAASAAVAAESVILAAPDMARALRLLCEANLPTGEFDADKVAAAQRIGEAALRKAGVLP